MKAFPLYFKWDDDQYNGMDLRDYFAAKAMQGMLSENSGIRYTTNELVVFAYKVADAMMEEREK